MEIVIAAVVLAAGLVAGASLLSRRAPALAGSRTSGKAAPAAPPAQVAASGTDADLKERRTEMVRLEERLLSKEAALDQQRASLATREAAVEEHQAGDRRPARAPCARARARRRPERVAGEADPAARSWRTQIRHEVRPARCARSRRRPSATPTAASATS